MPHKGKLPVAEKIKIVESYLSGEMGIKQIEAKYGVHNSTVDEWVRRFNARGAIGLCETNSNRKYDSSLKTQAVESYLAGRGSLRDICVEYDISDRKMLRQWIQCYNSHGDFKIPNSGGAIYMAKGRKTTQDERIEIVSHCISNNNDYGKTIEKYGVSYQQIYGWVRKYKKDGADGLVDRRGKRKDEASMSEVEKLRAQLKLKEAENFRLQMENDLLKKLEALERGIDID
jgi:transposase-like protein